MGIRSAIKKGLSNGFQPKRWFGVEQFQKNTKYCQTLISSISPESTGKSTVTENSIPPSFSDKDKKNRSLLAIALLVIYLIAMTATLIYAVILTTQSRWFFSAFTLLITFLISTHALRELMTYAQLKFPESKVTLKNLYQHLRKKSA